MLRSGVTIGYLFTSCSLTSPPRSSTSLSLHQAYWHPVLAGQTYKLVQPPAETVVDISFGSITSAEETSPTRTEPVVNIPLSGQGTAVSPLGKDGTLVQLGNERLGCPARHCLTHALQNDQLRHIIPARGDRGDLPRLIRVDAQPSHRVLCRRKLWHLQPRHRCNSHRLSHF